MNINVSECFNLIPDEAYDLANIARESLSINLIDIIADRCGLDDIHLFSMLRVELFNNISLENKL
jgi:hypothetical protein